MPTTAFKSPTAARELPWVDGSGEITNVSNVLSGGYATVSLPDGDTYEPSPTESAAGTVLPTALYQSGYDFSAVPSNALVKGISLRSTNYFTSDGDDDLALRYYFQFGQFADAVPIMTEDYLLWQNQALVLNLNTPTLQSLGGSADVWQPNPALYVDGMYVFSTDGSFPGYEVMASATDALSYDFFYNGHDLLIQPTTQSFSESGMDAGGCFSTFDYAAFLSGGGTVTLSFPGSGFPDTTFVAQAGATTPGDATFRCAVDNDSSLQSLSDQINYHPIASQFVSSNIFAGSQIWNLVSIDVGVYTNNIVISTNKGEYLYFPNGGQFSGGADADPNISTMVAVAAAPLVKTSGGPINAYPLVQSQLLSITNTITNLTLQTSIPASYFKSSEFGIAEWFNALATTGDALLYPSNTNTQPRLGKTEIALTYELPPDSSGLMMTGMG